MNTEKTLLIPPVTIPDERAIVQAAEPIFEVVPRIEIVTNEDLTKAADLLVQVKGLSKRVDLLFDPAVKAAHKTHRLVLAAKKKLSEPLNRTEGILKAKMADYESEKERIRQADQARLRELARKQEEERRLADAVELEKRGEDKAATELLEQPVAPPPVVLPKATPKIEGISSRQVWTYEIADEAVIPRQYLTVDHVKLRKYVQAMQKDAQVPGVRIFQKTQIAARA